MSIAFGREQPPPFIEVKAIGERVRETRQAAGLTLQDLASEIGVTCMAISQIERGKRTQLNPQLIRQIAQILGQPEMFFYGLSDCTKSEFSSIAAHGHSVLSTSRAWGEVFEKISTLPCEQQERIAQLIKEVLALYEMR